jgi:hypothetical protein
MDKIKLTVNMPYVMKGNNRAVTFQSDTPRFGPYLETATDFKNIFGYEGDLNDDIAKYGLSGAWGRTKDNNFRTRFGLRKFGGNDNTGQEIESHTKYTDAPDDESYDDMGWDHTWYWVTSSRVSINDKYQSFLTNAFGKVPPISFWIGSNAWEDTWNSGDSGVPNDCSGYLTDHDPSNYTFNFVFILWKHTNGMYYISN